MKRIGTMLGILTAATVARADAQARVSVSVGVASPTVSGYVVVGDRYVYRPDVVVIERRPRVHRSRGVIITERGRGRHKHGHHHRYHRHDDRVYLAVGVCGGGYGCR